MCTAGILRPEKADLVASEGVKNGVRRKPLNVSAGRDVEVQVC
jgi:hypothetical protein